MSKIDYSESGLKKYIIPDLDSSIKNIELCKNMLSSINIPQNFQHRSYLLSLRDNLDVDLAKIKNVKELLLKSSMIYLKNINDNITMLSNIDDISIKLRENFIKKA